MRLLRRHSLIVVVVVVVVVVIVVIIPAVVVVVGHLKSLHPQKQQSLSFENNTGQTDEQTDGQDLL